MTREMLDTLEEYEWALAEKNAVERQWDKLRLPGAPSGVRAQNLTGMPHGTNDPDEAAMQAIEHMAEILNAKWLEMDRIMSRAEGIIESIEDDRARAIVRYYYCGGESDERIAEKLGISRKTVNTIRNAACRVTKETERMTDGELKARINAELDNGSQQTDIKKRVRRTVTLLAKMDKENEISFSQYCAGVDYLFSRVKKMEGGE